MMKKETIITIYIYIHTYIHIYIYIYLKQIKHIRKRIFVFQVDEGVRSKSSSKSYLCEVCVLHLFLFSFTIQSCFIVGVYCFFIVRSMLGQVKFSFGCCFVCSLLACFWASMSMHVSCMCTYPYKHACACLGMHAPGLFQNKV